MMNMMPGRGALGALRGSKFGAGRAPSPGFGAFPPMGGSVGPAPMGAGMGQSPQGAMPPPQAMPSPAMGRGIGAPVGPGPGMQAPPVPTPMGATGQGASAPGGMPGAQGVQADPMVMRQLAMMMAQRPAG